MLSNRQEGRTEKKMPSPELGYIAYQFLYLEVSIRVFCVQSQTDPQIKVCSNTAPHLEYNTDIS
jgi:hypothetical protein